MYLTPLQTFIIIIAVALGAICTRFLPFLLFPDNRKPPKVVNYLGKVLPAAAMGLLVVYCLKSVSVFKGTHGIPEIIAIGVIVILHKCRKNTLLSICGGTLIYMLIIQNI